MTVRKLFDLPSLLKFEETDQGSHRRKGRAGIGLARRSRHREARAAVRHAAGRASARKSWWPSSKPSIARCRKTPAARPPVPPRDRARSTTSRSRPPDSGRYRLRHRHAPGGRTAQPGLPRPARRVDRARIRPIVPVCASPGLARRAPAPDLPGPQSLRHRPRRRRHRPGRRDSVRRSGTADVVARCRRHRRSPPGTCRHRDPHDLTHIADAIEWKSRLFPL